MSVKQDLTLSALQVYLAQTLLQTADFIRAAKKTSIIAGFSTVYIAVNTHDWTMVIRTAERLLLYTQNCLKAFETRPGQVLFGIYALCAVDSMQDCLREVLYQSKSKMHDNQREARDLVGHAYGRRAMLISYALAATHQNDPTLSSMWLQAAEIVREDTSLRRKCRLTLQKSADYHARAKSLDKKAKDMETLWSEGPIALHQRAACHFRHAAACEAISREHSHHHVAKLYLEARDICVVMESADLDERMTHEGALQHMKRAAELAAAHAEDSTEAHLHPEVLSAVCTARRLVAKAPRVRRLMFALKDEVEAVADTNEDLSKCQHTSLLPAWRKLVVGQGEGVTVLQSMLNNAMGGVRNAVSEDQIILQIQERRRTGIKVVHHLQDCCDRAAFYKQKAEQALQGARPSPLANKCLVLAAAHMDALVQDGSGFLFSDAFAQLDEYNHYSFWRPDYHQADTFASIAERAQDGVSEYLDHARGAEGARRDPREAAWWRKAAICLEQRAELLFQYETEIGPTSACRLFSKTIAPSKESERKENSFREAAEYLQLAFKHRALPDADSRQDGTRVALLYERAAELVIFRVESALACNASINLDTILTYLQDLIVIFNDSEPVPARVMALYESGCAYAAGVCSGDATPVPANWVDSCAYLQELAGRDTDNESRFCCASESSESVYLHYDFEGSDGEEDSYNSY